MRNVTGTRRGKTLPAAGLAVAAAAGLFLAACDNDGAGVEEAQGGSVSADPADAALSGDMPSEQDAGDAGDAAAGDAPEPTPGSASTDGSAGTDGADGAPAPDPVPSSGDGQAGTQQSRLELADYTVPLNGQDSMVCMFRDSQEADGFDWGCQAENFHAGWQATRGGDANGVAYRVGGDPVLYGLLGNAASPSQAGALDDGSVTEIGNRFVVDTTQPDAALITTDGVTARVTADSYEIVG